MDDIVGFCPLLNCPDTTIRNDIYLDVQAQLGEDCPCCVVCQICQKTIEFDHHYLLRIAKYTDHEPYLINKVREYEFPNDDGLYSFVLTCGSCYNYLLREGQNYKYYTYRHLFDKAVEERSAPDIKQPEE